MDILTAIKEAPEWVALLVALAWVGFLTQWIKHLQGRVERVTDRMDRLQNGLIGKLTQTDLRDTDHD